MVSDAEGGSPGAAHPGPASVRLPPAMLNAMVAHAQAELPNEACGVIVGDRPAADGGIALRFVPTKNRSASPYRYEIDATELLHLTIETDDADEVFWAIVHSHVASPARPSPTDVGLAFYPDALYLLVSLADEEPALGAFRIVGGSVHPVELVAGDPG